MMSSSSVSLRLTEGVEISYLSSWTASAVICAFFISVVAYCYLVGAAFVAHDVDA